MSCMNIGIYYNCEKVDKKIVDKLVRKINAAGGNAVVFSEAERIGGVKRLLVLGGDGTMLHAARQTAALRIPLVGINYGHLGFLTEFERGDEEKALELVLDSDCPLLECTMLEVDFNKRKALCLNELSLLRGVGADCDNRAVKISVTIDGSAAGVFNADGLIVTTPTGSTAYSLSAGGSIMMPECGTFQLTPVCAFSLRSRPIAYPDRYELQFFLPKHCKVVLCGDGIYLGEAGECDEIKVRKAKSAALFLTRNKHDCFRRLTEKIN